MTRYLLIALCLFGCLTAVAEEAAKQPFWAERLTGYLRASDGTELHYSVLLPAKSGRFPVIINYSGYDPGSIGGLTYLNGNTTMSASLDKTFLENGYAVMGVNARGTACSQGTFDFLGPKYGQDGYDIVEFAASQPWSDGAVGMANWSWAGMSQLLTASYRPPHLKAIAPGMVLGDPRLDSWAPGGVPAPAFINGWRMFLRERWAAAAETAAAEGDEQCLAQIPVNLEGEDQESITRKVMQHPLRDEWIQQRQIKDRTHLIEVPVLSMAAFQDEAVTSREGYYQETLDAEQVWMVQTNGGHDLYESLSFRPTLLAFFDHFLKGEDNGFDERPHLEVWMESTSDGMGLHGYFEQTQPGWVISLPDKSPAVNPVYFKLGGPGLLSADGAVTEGADNYRYPVPGPSVVTEYLSDDWGPMSPAWQEGSLAYTSAPLAENLLAYGSGSADLWVSSDASDVDLEVTLTEVRPDGQEVLVQRGWLRVSNRAIDEEMSTPVRPVLIDTPEAIDPLDPGAPVLARVELNKFAHVFRQGSRLRIWIDAPGFWGSYGFDYFSTPSEVTIWYDKEHVSQLVLGELPGIDIPARIPVCGTVLKQPCRPDPLAE